MSNARRWTRNAGYGCSGLLLLLIGGCVRQEVSRQLHVCLGNAKEVAAFRSALHELARREGMEFVDASEYAEKNIESLGVKSHMDVLKPIVHLALQEPNGSGLIASNVGLTAFEVGVGIDNSQLADRVFDVVSSRWEVTDVPVDRGMLPDPDCGSEL
ncbi:MAG: hypothetical protein FP825_07885 [Hyphomonas sp.]|uniref:hypothetical protein n=1 Tax=Hyphomonas sp. TaxID=87 RepID=UPI0017A1C359|nr:hypothetical protein [Hyphomonas sp.]MBU3919707.1 hypothetical protein [Alphaproteobacteria bacterium]MBA3068382.1 hypothetical protein [Hyphomonas sp.]MBU4060751.1 hypothetical protein [Alphaproteobacteria bacterium]MBU4164735.1 hypothetical protein [Alphaproteobacteria bacterium]MBU4569107.1 hypothetical protein [Alphaproteobacteria bacterium]